MKHLISAILIAAIGLASAPSFASCNYSWQTAKDGSRCGDRAADRRDGGR